MQELNAVKSVAHAPAAGATACCCMGACSIGSDPREDPPPITAPTASLATAEPVPKAKPCIMVAPRPDNIPPLCCCGAAGAGGAALEEGAGAAALGGGGALAGAALRGDDDLLDLPMVFLL